MKKFYNFVNSWSGPLYNEYCCNIEKEIISKYRVCKHTVFSRNDVSLAISKLKIENLLVLTSLLQKELNMRYLLCLTNCQYCLLHAVSMV